MVKFFRQNPFLLDLLNLILILSLSPLFFYKLGQSSLTSWDEAWYAQISKHIMQTGDLFNLVFNNYPFVDHPPGGVWITAALFKLFGVTEFTARLLSTISAIFSLILTYILGKKIFQSRTVGLASAIALCSSFWFLYRARLGDLDSLLTLFYLLTFFLAIKAAENKKYLFPFGLSFAYLTTIKVFVPFLILPSLIFIFWKSKRYKLKDFTAVFALTALFYGLWIVIQYIKDPNLVYWHFFNGIRRGDVGGNLWENAKLFQTYLHNGVGKWFWPGIIGILLGFFLKNKNLTALSLFFMTYSLPFFFSPQVHIWHLIPLYPFMILAFFGVVSTASDKLINLLNLQKINFLVPILLILFAGFIGFTQLRAAWYQFIDIPAFVTDEAILSRESKNYPDQVLYIDGDFNPAAAFYSDKSVVKLKQTDLRPLIEEGKPFLIITNTWRLTGEGIPNDMYKILKTDRDKVLIKNPSPGN